MQRQQVLGLYRRILRSVKEIPDEYYQNEMKEWARRDFKNNKTLKDAISIKMEISRGERSLKQLQTTISLAK